MYKHLKELGKRLKEWTAEWRDLGSQCLERVAKPMSRTTATIYLVVAVAGLGGAGLWTTLVLSRFGYAEPHEIALHAGTYAFAIIVTSIGDLFLDREASVPLRFLLFGAAMVGLVLSCSLAYWWVFSAAEHQPIALRALMGVAAPVWVTWWLVNGSDQRFIMAPTPTAAIGGNAGQQIT